MRDETGTTLIPWHRRAGFDIQEFSAGGIRTFAVIEGRRETFPVIFLHGFPGGAFMWEYAIAALGRQRLAIAPDFPGWGRSVSRFAQLPPPTPEWSLNWLNGLLTAHQIDRFDLVAHGEGCWLALELLTAHPERVRRLGLISPRLWGPNKKSLVSALFNIFTRPEPWSTGRLQKWLADHAAFSPKARDHSAQELAHLCGSNPPVLREQLYAEHFDTYRRVLTCFRGRTLLIWGENDPAYSRQHSEELVSHLDRPDVHRITPAGYFPMLDQPQEVTPVLKEFLAD